MMSNFAEEVAVEIELPNSAIFAVSHIHYSSPVDLVSLATWLDPLRRFVLAHPWDVDVEGVWFCWSVARRAERKQNRTPRLTLSTSSAEFSGSGTTPIRSR
jgi:hypothetical protein